MNTIKFESKGNIKMIAHRGVSGLERENTCPAFVAGGVKSYYGIETDVHVTADGKYIIIHDDDLKRIAGLDMVVRESLFEDLRQVKLLDKDNKIARADLFLPTLDEYLSICKKYGKVAVLELKEDMKETDVVGIANAVCDMEMFESTTFISFSRNNMLYLKKNFPNADAQFLSGSADESVSNFIIENGLDADIYCRSIDKAFVDLMHSHGRVVNAWTVDTLEEAERLAECGIDMITSNILE